MFGCRLFRIRPFPLLAVGDVGIFNLRRPVFQRQEMGNIAPMPVICMSLAAYGTPSQSMHSGLAFILRA
jgi:hypothetical protein